MIYEYECRSCKDRIVEDVRLEDLDQWGHSGDFATPLGDDIICGPLRRVWSVGFQIKSTDWGH